MKTVTVKLDIRVIDLESLVETARAADSLKDTDLMEIARLIPDHDIVAALQTAIHDHPPIPGTELVNVNVAFTKGPASPHRHQAAPRPLASAS